MFKSRIHATLRDPAWWIFVICFVILLWVLLAQDVQSAGALYTLSKLQKYSKAPGALKHFNKLFGTEFETMEAFFENFVPDYLERSTKRLIPEIANNSNALTFVWLFPTFFIIHRIYGANAELPLSAGNSRITMFVYCVTELMIVMYLILDLTALFVILPFTRGPGQIPQELLRRLLLLRPLVFIAWCMPMVLLSFLLQNMILSGVASFAVLIAQVVIVFNAPEMLPYLKLLNREFWVTGGASEGTLAQTLAVCLIYIIIWLAASFAVFMLKDIRRAQH